MKAKLLRRLAVTTGLSVALLSSGATPANAVAAGDGVVAGDVTIVSPGGIDLTTRPTSFEFSGTNITGTIAGRDNSTGQVAAFAGTIAVDRVTGGSPGENTISGQGSVNGFGFSGSTTVGPVTTTVSGTITSGTFARVGPTVIVILNVGTITITVFVNGNQVAKVIVNGGTVIVHAGFVPAVGQNGLSPTVPGGTPITNASFVGDFAVASAG